MFGNTRDCLQRKQRDIRVDVAKFLDRHVLLASSLRAGGPTSYETSLSFCGKDDFVNDGWNKKEHRIGTHPKKRSKSSKLKF